MTKLLIIATFFVLLSYATCYDCYDCQNCEIPFNSQTSSKTCNTNVTTCMKITAKLGTVYTYIAKQCGPCLSETFLFGVTYLHVDCCSGNECNGTNILSIFYINHIYKRNKSWNEILSPLKNTPGESCIFLMPRQSMLPLIQEFLPKHLKQQRVKRKMITQLQFNEPPLFVNNLQQQWDEMNSNSICDSYSSYYSIEGCMSCKESISDEQSLMKYFSITSSSDELNISHSSSEKQFLFKSFNNEKSILDKNNSSNYIVLEMEPCKKINILNNVLQL
ncbi:unnamed protein product [Adineta steineri]|uniref:Uncharacterized protein n=1 Tax=Adineta steineri TaxID=433720 RepID=A0A814YRX5_9BILA|nr:unnamed protein product [Adineta steineri]CAF1257018.1 unnamed protein product [Adineta steineri]